MCLLIADGLIVLLILWYAHGDKFKQSILIVYSLYEIFPMDI